MNRFYQVFSFIVTIASVTIAMGAYPGLGFAQTLTGDDLPTNAIQPYQQPSAEAAQMYHILLGEIAGQRNQLDAALENYRIVALASDDPKIAERAMNIALLMGDKAAALAMGRRWFALDTANPRARQALSLLLLNNGLVEEAIPYLEAIRASADDDGQEGFTTVVALLSQVQDKATTLRALEILRDLHPTSRYALYYYAGTALGAGEHEKALAGVDAVLEQNPQWSAALLLQARVRIAMDDKEGAIAGLAKAVATMPDDRNLRMGYARMLAGTDRLDAARSQFQKLIEQEPDDPEPFYALGLMASEQKHYDEAVTNFLEVIKRAAHVMDAYYELGRVEEQRGNYQKARDWYSKVNDDEHYLSAQVRIGAMLAKLGDFAGMTQHFTKVRRLNPQSEVALYISEADVLREEKRYQEAFEVLSNALAQHAGNEDLLYSRALAAEKINRLDVLEQDLRTLIDANPKNGQALNALGYTLADRTERRQEALGYLQRAIVLLPDDAAVVDSMGWIQYRLGHMEESLKYLRRAYEINPDPEIGAHLVEVLWVTGQQSEARQLLQSATEKNPESDYLRKVKERFKL